MQIHDRLALVTGASSGIGAATAAALAKKGARVVLVSRTESALETVAAAIRAGGGYAHVLAGDVSDAATAGELHRRCVAECGHPEIVVNSAGAGRWLFTEETDPAEMVQMMAAPYFCAFYVTRLCLPEMLRRRAGHIVNINSPAIYLPWPGSTGYTAARFALYGFTRALQLDLYGTGVRGTSIVPGRTATEYFDRNPGTLPRAPTAERLIRPILTPRQVAARTVRAIERNEREVILPFMLRFFVGVNHFAPWLVQWLIVRTGWRHHVAAGADFD